MLCSISTTGKSSSKWLDRLRSSKGFPSGTDLDLEQFINSNQNSSSSNTEQAHLASTSEPKLSSNDLALHSDETFETQNPDGDTRLLSIMSNVLAELFVMGDSSNLPKIQGEKCSRKQPNPKFCAPINSPEFNADSNNNSASTENATRKSESASPISDDNSGVGTAKDWSSEERLKLVEDVNCGDDEKKKGCVNLSGFSRTEVTVIDTSFATWKIEKMLFRKKNLWKVRDKKGKMVNLGKKKKRKASARDNENGGGGEEKKQKFLHGQCSSSKKGCGGAFNEESYQPNKLEAACKKIPSNTFGKASKKNRETLNSEKGGSTVILIKNIPTNKKIGASLPQSCPKWTQRQPKA